MSESVEATTRAQNVEAFIVWSTYAMNAVSMASAASCDGSSPNSM